MGSWILHGSETGRLKKEDKRREEGGGDSHADRLTSDTRCHLHYADCCIKEQHEGALFFNAPQGFCSSLKKRKYSDLKGLLAHMIKK